MWIIGRRPAWLLLVAVTAACSSHPLGRWFRAVEAGSRSDGSAVVSAAGVRISVHEMRPAERRSYLRASTSVTVDPFDLYDGRRPVFRTLLLAIDNASGDVVRFNPSFVVLHVDQDRHYPLGYTDLYPFLRQAFGDDERVELLARAFSETSLEVLPGAARDILLVFNRIDDRVRRVELEITGVDIGQRALGARFAFERSAAE